MPRGILTDYFIDLGVVINGLPSALIGPTATITGTQQVQAKLNQYAEQFGSPGRFLRAAGETYRRYMVDNMLSGQRLRRRSGRLASAWRVQRDSKTEYRVTPGRLPYARVHEYGLDYPQQPVRGYTTRSGKKVKLYLRHMKLRERRYVRDTIIEADSLVSNALDSVATSIVNSVKVKSGEQ